MQQSALMKLTHGLYIVGAEDTEQKRFCGLIVDAVMQVASKPNILALSLMNSGYTKSQIEKTNRFSLSILGESTLPSLIANFGFQSSRTVNKWENTDYIEKSGLPYLAGSLADIQLQVIDKRVFESHTLFLSEVVDAWDKNNEKALTYSDYQTKLKDDVLKEFLIKKGVKKMETKEKWVCVVCGYIYEGDVPFEELPDDWTCPLCGVGKDMFEKRAV